MRRRGIYTLANDAVFDQLVALVNSIEENISFDIPICIIPYNQQIERVSAFISQRPNCSLFENERSLIAWDTFINAVWPAHPRSAQPKYTHPNWYKGFVHRKFAAFDGPFDQFIFFDADSLAMKSCDDVWERLEEVDLVFDDWEHAKRGEQTEVHLNNIQRSTRLELDEIYPQIHCDSFFGSHKGLISAASLPLLLRLFVEEGYIHWVRDRSWWSTSALFSCITLLSKCSLFNFTRSSNWLERTGNCADADPFVKFNHVLYNADGGKPIRRIHYMNYASADFARLCRGESVDIRYRDIFLHYRFLSQPEQQPKEFFSPDSLLQLTRRLQKLGSSVQKLNR
ncbi:MAG: Npun_R2821/Npun_R2822 family protein [Cyanobacteria bacterium J06623_5]